MRLKLYRAPGVAEAMALVRAELGPEALILSTRRTATGIELTAALEPEEAAPDAPAADLGFHGIPPAIAARLARPDLAQALRGLLRFGPLPVGGVGAPDGTREARPLLLAGAPGAGKTLSIARLATRLVLSGINPLVITADGRRAGAPEELAAYTRLLGLSLMVASTPASLARALAARQAQAGPGTPVLIDTGGVNPFAAAELAELAELAASCAAIPVLVMPAGQHPDEAAEQAAAFSPLGAGHLLATRLDLARRLGSLITAAVAGDLILTEAGVGSGPADSLVALTPEFLAARLRPAPAAAAPPAAPAPKPPAGLPLPHAGLPRTPQTRQGADGYST